MNRHAYGFQFTAGSRQDAPIEIFKRMEQIFRQLESYTGVMQTKCCKDLIERVMLTVLFILTIATEEIKQGRASEFLRDVMSLSTHKNLEKYFKKLVGRTDVEDALQRLDELILEVTRMVTVEPPNTTYGVTSGMITHGNPARVDQLPAFLTFLFSDGEESTVAISRVENDVRDPIRPSTTSARTSGGSDTILRLRLLDEIRGWLSPPDPSTNLNVACQARHKGTAQWFLRGGTFEAWKATSSLLWIHGKRTYIVLPPWLEC